MRYVERFSTNYISLEGVSKYVKCIGQLITDYTTKHFDIKYLKFLFTNMQTTTYIIKMILVSRLWLRKKRTF